MTVQVVSEACKKAEQMVSAIKDPSYRLAAFQVVFGKLLGHPDPSFDRDEPNVPKHDNGNQVKSETQRRVLELVSEGFFNEPKLPSEVHSQLRTQGFHHNPSDVRMALLRLARKRQLRRLQEGDNQYRYALP